MTKYKGQNTVELAIIITLVAIACVIIYTQLGDQIKKLFTSSEKKYENFKPFEFSNTSNIKQPEGGYLGGTNDQPVSKCTNDNCTVDFGEFVLTGLPANFQDFVQSGGTSGGTDKLASLFEQIAKQLEEEGNSEGSKKFKDLANLGHYCASLQKASENIAQKSLDGYFGQNFDITGSTLTYSHIDLSRPDNISQLISTDLKQNSGTFIDLFNMSKIELPSNKSYPNEKVYPGATMNLIYKDIISDKSMPDSIKKVATETMLLMHTLSSEHQFKLDTTNDNKVDIQAIVKPQTSIKSNITSEFICTTGKNDDTGKACHNK